MRDYDTMRRVLMTAAGANQSRVLCYNDFRQAAGNDDDVLEHELVRLRRDGLIEGDIHFSTGFGDRVTRVLII